MVIVYFESGTHAEIVGIFPDEASYSECYPILERMAEKAGMFVTESVIDEVLINDVAQFIKESGV